MLRPAMNQLKEWKNKKYRKLLIIKGARQVGKTWLMREFVKMLMITLFMLIFITTLRLIPAGS